MTVAFVETMRGTLRDSVGAVHPVDFHVRATGGSQGRFALSGVIHAAPWRDEAAVTGTLELSLAPASIAYDLHFVASDGSPLRLHGSKRPTLRAPITSMTVLSVTLSDEADGTLAEGTIRFDLLELPTFLASWLPFQTTPHRQLAARRVAVARREIA